MSLAADTRAAVRAEPFLFDALRAGVVNYAGLARDLDLEGDDDAIAAALRRFAEELDPPDPPERSVRVRMESGLAPAERSPLFVVGGLGYEVGGGDRTGVIASGELDPAALERVLGLLRVNDVAVDAAGVTDETLLVVVPRRDGPEALRTIENDLAG